MKLSERDEELLWQDRWLALLQQVAELEQDYVTGNTQGKRCSINSRAKELKPLD